MRRQQVELAASGFDARVHARVMTRRWTVYIDVFAIGAEATDAVEAALRAGASVIGAAACTAGPFTLDPFDPPKCIGRLAIGDPAPAVSLESVAAAVAASLRAAGYVVDA